MSLKKHSNRHNISGFSINHPICMFDKYGFTLIELLVVIAIIALLVSILLPSLSKAKDIAKEVVCKSNLHQVGLGTSYYVSDNNGEWPSSEWTPWNQWFRKLQPYFSDGTRLTTGDSYKILHCPSHAKPVIDASGYTSPQTHFAMNLKVTGFSVIGYYIREGVSISYLLNPSQRLLLVDNNDAQTNNNWRCNDRPYGADGWYFNIGEDIHNKGVNVLFADYHVEYDETPLPFDSNNTIF